jgi:hypothetical protein
VIAVPTANYYEIPPSELGKDFLFVTQIAKTRSERATAGSRSARWWGAGSVAENRILLREMSYDLVADPSEPIAKPCKPRINPSIVMAFNIEAFGPDDAAVIEVTRLFMSDVPEMSVRANLRARGMDTSRSFIRTRLGVSRKRRSEATHTYTSAPPDPQAAAVADRRTCGTRWNAVEFPVPVLVHFSMVKLPEKPMMPRLADARVGYFTTATWTSAVRSIGPSAASSWLAGGWRRKILPPRVPSP